MPNPGSSEWLDQIQEEILDPARPIVDPHHHLWAEPRRMGPYLLPDLWADTESGHNVVQTVFLECGANYRTGGPEHLRLIGETEFVSDIARASAAGEGATISAIVGRADLTRGEAVKEVLDAHAEAAGGLFRGIRHAAAHPEHPEALLIPGRAPKGLYADSGFRQGLNTLGRLGLTYDAWHYHYQNRELVEAARAAPETTIILDHFGTPLGVGPYAAQREEIFEDWKKSIAELATCPNIVAKIGGLAMPDNGFGWDTRDAPPTSDEFVAAQSRYYLHTIECFGPDRCMFESNFPVDRLSISYPVLYNGLKKIAAAFTESEKTAMFSGTARRVYKLAGGARE